MNEIELYRLLQTAAGTINQQAVGLYNGTVTKEEAIAAAKPIVDQMKAALDAAAGQ